MARRDARRRELGRADADVRECRERERVAAAEEGGVGGAPEVALALVEERAVHGLAELEEKGKGCVVMATVKGDVHDIGKVRGGLLPAPALSTSYPCC